MTKTEIFKKIKEGFDLTLQSNGLGNGYIILCVDTEDGENQIQVKIDGVILTSTQVMVIGSLVKRAQDWYNEICHAQSIMDQSKF